MNEVSGLPIACALAIVCVLLPVSWHWKAKNTGTLLYIGWTVVANLNLMINSIVWRGRTEDLAPAWCSISTKIVVGQSIGLTAASMCINRKLYNIATIQSVSITPESKRRTMIADLSIGVLFPIIVMGLHYIVQMNKYLIFENIGCWPATENTLVALPLVFIWPLLICCTSFVYCVLSIRGFLKARQQFNQLLNNSGSGINLSRYFRLLALASEEIIFAVPFAVYILRANLTQGSIPPWVSLDYLHRHYNTITPISWELMQLDQRAFNVILVSLWVVPGGGFLFFIWFGLGGEAFAAYKKIFYSVVSPFGIKPKPKEAPAPAWQNHQLASNTSSMPVQSLARVPSLPNLYESEEPGDLEAAKAHV
ncbi:Pheromone B alpha 3 receptor [Schizophyllum commune H4-8] [Rhizoctonia solani]|uniref:Pheromone B alpha 3 receptor [Schizophyllum commune H4-8] n=1 Tax=Rhizoctonia solani TaxID=456999 RepID=A0A0K6GBD3_9AGAM|nr:Pheromone B alpha 3 receptor [Schizophyllum commune H4-8] [Rhizoctonia solani]